MARTRATIEMELAVWLNVRFGANSANVREEAHERVMELRAELAVLKAAELARANWPEFTSAVAEVSEAPAETRQAKESTWLLCGSCGNRSPFDNLFCDHCGTSFADAMEA